MTEKHDTAVRIARDYHRAWAARDVEGSMAFIDDAIVCEAPAGTLTGAAAFRGFLGTYFQLLIDSDLLAVFGDGDEAVLVTENHTHPVPVAPSATYLTVSGGRITRMLLMFDRVPYQAAAK